jgi:hypothetical protein
MSGVASEGVKGECVKVWTSRVVVVSPFTLHLSPFTCEFGCLPALS